MKPNISRKKFSTFLVEIRKKKRFKFYRKSRYDSEQFTIKKRTISKKAFVQPKKHTNRPRKFAQKRLRANNLGQQKPGLRFFDPFGLKEAPTDISELIVPWPGQIPEGPPNAH